MKKRGTSFFYGINIIFQQGSNHNAENSSIFIYFFFFASRKGHASMILTNTIVFASSNRMLFSKYCWLKKIFIHKKNYITTCFINKSVLANLIKLHFMWMFLFFITECSWGLLAWLIWRCINKYIKFLHRGLTVQRYVSDLEGQSGKVFL